jgi:hypothetical protein
MGVSQPENAARPAAMAMPTNQNSNFEGASAVFMPKSVLVMVARFPNLFYGRAVKQQ